MEKIYVGDLTPEETKKYILQRKVKPQTRVDLIKRLAGGRVGLLAHLCDEQVQSEEGLFGFRIDL